VVTLVRSPGAICKGVAYRVEHAVFEHLDHREKNGYERHAVTVSLGTQQREVGGILYVARADNPAFLGPASMPEIAAHIARSHGPSGSNRDYLLQLAAALRELDDPDPHVRELEALLLAT
jgi:cation transport regulator ChaC